ncbi:MAG: hypothetical protein FWB80_14100 [Defluviitaleaceae bacterium]|nr:hypothetical protein [Defluviitaleaceae bacterium]
MRYTIIGGINGVGKSTIYSSLPDGDVRALGKRVNVDEIWLYDNTSSYTPVAQVINGKTKVLDKNIPTHILDCLR